MELTEEYPISLLQKAAVICFALGKFQLVAVIITMAARPEWVWYVVGLYAGLIAASIVLVLMDWFLRRTSRIEARELAQYYRLKKKFEL